MKMLVSEYDASGLLGVIYAKKQYLNVLKKTEIPLWDLVTNSDKYDEEKEMLACFMSPELNRAEKECVIKGKIVCQTDEIIKYPNRHMLKNLNLLSFLRQTTLSFLRQWE